MGKTSEKAQGSKTVEEKTSEKANPKVFFDLNIGGHPTSRLVIELFTDTTPITAENFQALCTDEKGIGRNMMPLYYKGTIFRRVIPSSVFTGGDLTDFNGLGGDFIYGDSFASENFVNKHTGPGILSMANTGPNTNDSQFLISNAKNEWLNGTIVVFGQVIEGFDVMKAVEKVGSISGLTSKPVMVANCAQLTVVNDHYGLGYQAGAGTDLVNGLQDVKSFDHLTENDLRSSHSVLPVHMKPLVAVLAIDRIPGPMCFFTKFSSSKLGPYIDSPPVPFS
ncbi:hypothetical protein EZV62_012328 [Acer yangbiense]|uniref:Peptidyl-prolyl cis-trans isomerase n=1 Tax=Acer yangbiense TaxID=1000413 RepID=A0A5C7HVZ5_9ROSI|nr:hypothetical protein EZV62_012328 [Acer yangbiense]